VKIYKTIILVQLINILIGCAGNPPSITNFMDHDFVRSAQVNIWSGDLINEDADTIEGPYIFERPANVGAGLYYGDMLRYGLELGLSGVNGIIGIKNNNFGTLLWANINGTLTGGVATAQQIMLSENNSIGVFEYLSKNSIAKYDQTELGRSQNGSITYGEYGIGVYLRQRIYENIHFSIETKYGNQVESNRERYYLGINVDYK
jgi:hypothetical protein